jgi:Zn-dependent protease
MNSTVSLGRIAGIQIGLNWTLFIAFFLIAASLAGSLLPADVPGYSAAAYTVAGLAAVVLFYGSLLAHELGHAIVARRLGTRVDGITLWLFGGVARLSGDSPSGSAELKITLVGPAITIAVGAIFAVIAAALQTVNAFPLTADVLAWLARINFLLAAFNLIPAFPLDGGRVLRAILWKTMHNRIRATTIAAWLGRAFGFVLIGAGAVELFLTRSFINGLWLALLGWFLIQAAGSQEMQTQLQGSLAGVRARDVMVPGPTPAPDWVTVEEFIARFAALSHATGFPVQDFSGQLSGLVTLRELASVPMQARAITRVRDIALPLSRVPVAGPDEMLVDVLRRLDDPDGTHILVMVGPQLIGLISPADIRRTLILSGTRHSAASGFSPSA